MSQSPEDAIAQLRVLYDPKFRKVKHDIRNSLAVMMALAEMAKRNPNYGEKLTAAVIERGQQIVEELDRFSEEFKAVASLPHA